VLTPSSGRHAWSNSAPLYNRNNPQQILKKRGVSLKAAAAAAKLEQQQQRQGPGRALPGPVSSGC